MKATELEAKRWLVSFWLLALRIIFFRVARAAVLSILRCVRSLRMFRSRLTVMFRISGRAIIAFSAGIPFLTSKASRTIIGAAAQLSLFAAAEFDRLVAAALAQSIAIDFTRLVFRKP